MLARLVQFSLSQRLFVLLVTLLVAGAGGYAYRGGRNVRSGIEGGTA